MKRFLYVPVLAALTILPGCDERTYHFYAQAFGTGLGWEADTGYDSGEGDPDGFLADYERKRAREQAKRDRARDVAGVPPRGPSIPPRAGEAGEGEGGGGDGY